MAELKYLVVEYCPHLMDGTKTIPARIDGHYAKREMAEEVAALWAGKPKHAETRIVVVEVVHEEKMPAHWIKELAK